MKGFSSGELHTSKYCEKQWSGPESFHVSLGNAPTAHTDKMSLSL